MKKLLMVVVVILVAGLSKAASVNWNTGVLYVPNANGTFSATTVAQNAAGYSAIVSFFLADGVTPVTGLAGNSSSTVTALHVLQGTSTITGGFLANNTYYAQIVVTDVNSGGYIMTSTKSAFTIPGTGDRTINFLSGSGFVVTGNKMPSQWTPVPEPATFALMGVGLAVLGLRRRFMKK